MGRLRNGGPEVTKDGHICPDERIVGISKLVDAIDRVQLLTQGYRTSAESRKRRFICIFKLGLNADVCAATTLPQQKDIVD
jgi:SUMO ligase MMS21 Smc5/6 complex component